MFEIEFEFFWRENLMAGRWELGFPKSSASSLKEKLARNILRNVRSQGHPYVELREEIQVATYPRHPARQVE